MIRRCASSSSRRCIRRPPRRTSASSCRASSGSSPRAGTRSSAWCSTAAAAGSCGTHASALRAIRAARRFRPDVVYAHFLFPTGLSALLAARASRAPLVVTAHGQDVANVTRYPFVRRPTRTRRPARRRGDRGLGVAARRARARRARGGRQDRGGRLRRRPRAVPAARPGRRPRPRLRLRRLADRAQERRPARGRVRATRRGDADLRRRRGAAAASSRVVPASRSPGTCRTTRCPAISRPPMSSASRASSSRSARRRSRRWPPPAAWSATRVGGPPEFVPAGAGVLVDPEDEDALADALRAGGRAPGPEPGRACRRPSRTTSGVRRLGWRRFSSEPFEVGEPDLDERPDRVLDPRLARELERLLVALPRLSRARRPASAGCRP